MKNSVIESEVESNKGLKMTSSRCPNNPIQSQIKPDVEKNSFNGGSSISSMFGTKMSQRHPTLELDNV